MRLGHVIGQRPRARKRLLVLAGCLAVSAGVALHLPMFVADIAAGRMMMGMPLDPAMLAGMGLILFGTLIAGAALWHPVPGGGHPVRLSPPATVGPRHGWLAAALVLVLVIDTMKPATLGFVVPGMAAEYELPRATVAWLPFAALTGTVVGSVVWGWFADHHGRRAAILLSTLLFIGTAICGAMPSFGWNVVMCFTMGASAGGMLPVAYALLAEVLPTRWRGLLLVLVGGLGAAGGFFAASGAAALLDPVFGWRALWLIGLPTGLLALVVSLWLPESPAYLVRAGRTGEARRELARFGGVLDTGGEGAAEEDGPLPVPEGRGLVPLLVLVGTLWGLANFGLLLWLPTMLAEAGLDVAESGRLLASSSFVAVLTIAPAALLYQRLGGGRALVLSTVILLLGLGGVATVGVQFAAVLLLMIGVNAVVAMLLPHAAECAPATTRGRAVGWVAAGSKAGGLLAQAATLAGLAPAPRAAAVAILIPLAAAVAAVALRERRPVGRVLAAVPTSRSRP